MAVLMRSMKFGITNPPKKEKKNAGQKYPFTWSTTLGSSAIRTSALKDVDGRSTQWQTTAVLWEEDGSEATCGSKCN
eukprot:6189959-Pleurochrysis_carterae.AAC.1